MIIIKTPEEINLIKQASKICQEVKQILFDAIKPGVKTIELDQIAYQEIVKRGGKPAFLDYHGFPNTLCISVNEQVIHGIPSQRILKNGDLVKIDIGVIYKEYYCDSAFTKGVGQISASNQKLIEIAKNAFYAGLNQIKPGARVGDIENAIGTYVASQKMFVPANFTGHGIGKNLHEDPSIHNQGVAKTGPLLRDGMVICIEPMILQQTNKVKILNDGWTVVSLSKLPTAHYEHTILIENGYPVILTAGI